MNKALPFVAGTGVRHFVLGCQTLCTDTLYCFTQVAEKRSKRNTMTPWNSKSSQMQLVAPSRQSVLRFKLNSIATLFATLALVACSGSPSSAPPAPESTAPATAPSSPSPSPSPSPTADAGPAATQGSATLDWDASTSASVTGYRVYYGTMPGSYQTLGTGLAAGNATSFTVSGLQKGQQYYFAVTAVDATGAESPYSNEASKLIQ